MTLKGKPPPHYTFLFMSLQFLPDDCRNMLQLIMPSFQSTVLALITKTDASHALSFIQQFAHPASKTNICSRLKQSVGIPPL